MALLKVCASAIAETNPMTDVELLNVNRSRRFIEFTLAHDLQVKANRSQAGSLLSRCIAGADDLDIVEFPAEKFDKVMTFFSENDRQVHYNERDTIGVYAITRLLGELRRILRDYQSDTVGPMDLGGIAMASPRDPPPRGTDDQKNKMRLNLGNMYRPPPSVGGEGAGKDPLGST